MSSANTIECIDFPFPFIPFVSSFNIMTASSINILIKRINRRHLCLMSFMVFHKRAFLFHPVISISILSMFVKHIYLSISSLTNQSLLCSGSQTSTHSFPCRMHWFWNISTMNFHLLIEYWKWMCSQCFFKPTKLTWL